MALILTHQSVGRISLKDHPEASDSLGMQFTIEQHLRLVVGADIPAGQRQWIVEVYRQLLYGAGVVVIWNLTLLCKFYLLEVDGIERGQ